MQIEKSNWFLINCFNWQCNWTELKCLAIFLIIDLKKKAITHLWQNGFNQASMAGASAGNVMKSHHHNKSIPHNELQGLISVCKLVTQIVTHNEKIRLLLFDFQYGEAGSLNYAGGFNFNENKMNMYGANNQTCSFAVLMFGLLTCPIPTLLKGNKRWLFFTFLL